MKINVVLVIFGLFVAVNHIQAAEWSGFAALDLRSYVKAPIFPEQNNQLFAPSGVIQPEFRHEWQDGVHRLTVIPFGRIDSLDNNRTHFDIRELNWLYQNPNWSVRAGIGRVFWGVAESRHLVDIVNQIDYVENINNEEKLGQPMVNINIPSAFGNFNFIYLPYFRDRTFPAIGGRLRFVPPVDENAAQFNNTSRWHQDWAVRWSRTFGSLDIGLAHFMGIGREPRLVPRFDNGPNTFPTALVPVYDLIHQTSLDAQASVGNWLFKLEAITRSGQGKRFAAVVAGAEYTHYGLLGTNADLGILVEYLYDGRDKFKAPPTPFNNDIFFGLRLAVNDMQNTQLLAGVTTDLANQGTIGTITASRRIGEKWRIELESRFFTNIASDRPSTEILTGYRRDDYIQLRLAYFF